MAGVFGALTATNLIIGAVVLAVMVFGITLAVTLMGNGGAGTPRSTAPASPDDALTFRTDTVWPPPPQKPDEKPRAEASEIGKEKQHDFWFKNTLDRVVEVGMIGKPSCKCTSVEVWVAPNKYRDWPKEEGDEVEKATHAMEHGEAIPVDLLRQDAAAVVPPGGVGWVRVKWRGKQEGGQQLTAELWTGQKGVGPTTKLQINALFLPPLWVKPLAGKEVIPHEFDLTGDGLTLADLGKNGKTYDLVCWSATRDEFELKARAANSRWDAEEDPFEVGTPKPLSKEQLAGIVAGFPDVPPVTPPLAGYQVSVTLLPKARKAPPGKDKEGKDKEPRAWDLGRFKRWVEFTSNNFPDVVTVKVFGKVTGDVTTPGLDGGVAQFGTFKRDREQEVPVVVETAEEVTALELDRDRTAPYLDADLPKDGVRTGARKTWTVQVKIPPRKVSGQFPDDTIPTLRDSAIYIRTVGPNAACIRIPATGTANEPDEK
jgi:hypothetical protein